MFKIWPSPTAVMAPALKPCFETMINIKQNNLNFGQIGKIEI